MSTVQERPGFDAQKKDPNRPPSTFGATRLFLLLSVCDSLHLAFKENEKLFFGGGDREEEEGVQVAPTSEKKRREIKARQDIQRNRFFFCFRF